MRDRDTASVIVSVSEHVSLYIDKVSGAFCVLTFALMTLVTLLGVFFRYVMKSPFMWTEEAARYLLVWMGFIAISVALRRNRHIKIEFLISHVSPGASKILGYVADGFVTFFLIVFLYQGYRMTVGTLMTASTMPISMFWIYMALPAAAVLTLAQLILKTIVSVFSQMSSNKDEK